MSLTLASVICLVAANQSANERVTFDLLSYVRPSGATELQTDSLRSYTIGRADSDYSQVIIYKSLTASSDAKKNFDASWEALVKDAFGSSGKPDITGPVDAGSVKIVSGVGGFELEKIKFAAILTNYTRGDKTQNVLIITNSEKHSAVLGSFADSIKPVATAEEVKSPGSGSPSVGAGSPIGTNTQRIKGARVPTLYMRVYRDTSVYKNFDWIGIYSNGDFMPHLPDTGFYGFDKPLQAESWGKWTKSGSQVTLEGKFYGKQQFDVISEREWRVRNSQVLRYFKQVSVTGLKLEGNYSAEGLGWKRNHQDPLKRTPTYIAFRKDGTFTDYGCYHSSTRETPLKGKYEVRDYSLILKYSDGVEVQRSFTGVGSEDPTKTRDFYCIGGFGWFLEAAS